MKDIMTTQNVLMTLVIACSSSSHHNIPKCHQGTDNHITRGEEKAKRKKFMWKRITVYHQSHERGGGQVEWMEQNIKFKWFF